MLPKLGSKIVRDAIPTIFRGIPVVTRSLMVMWPLLNPTTFDGDPVGNKYDS